MLLSEVPQLEPIIIFLTDGDPTVGQTDPTRIINHLTEKNSGQNKATIFSLAFGNSFYFTEVVFFVTTCWGENDEGAVRPVPMYVISSIITMATWFMCLLSYLLHKFYYSVQ